MPCSVKVCAERKRNMQITESRREEKLDQRGAKGFLLPWIIVLPPVVCEFNANGRSGVEMSEGTGIGEKSINGCVGTGGTYADAEFANAPIAKTDVPVVEVSFSG
jgi:hypothetical protein